MAINVDILDLNDKRLPPVPPVTRGLADLLRMGDVDVEDVIHTISQESQLAKGTLHLLNSPVFHPRRPVADFRRAAVMLGPRNVLSVTIAFSVIDTFNHVRFNSLDRDQFFLRALASASVARLLSEKERGLAIDECILAALLQDFGMIVIDALAPQYYGSIAPECRNHADYVAREVDDFGLDHAAVTRALLRHWGVADYITDACGLSHYSDILSSKNKVDRLGYIAGVSSLCGDLFYTDKPKVLAQELRVRCERDLGWTPDQLPIFLNLLRSMSEEIEPLVTELKISPAGYKQFCQRAREVLQPRLFAGSQPPPEPPPQADPDGIADALDAATGLYNRVSFPQVLQTAMDKCTYDDEPLSIVFLSLVNYPRLKQERGAEYTDALLRSIGEVLEAWVRRDDIPGRIADGVFAVAMPKAPAQSCDAITRRLRDQCELAIPPGEDGALQPRFAATHVTHYVDSDFGSASGLLDAGTDALLAELRPSVQQDG